MGPKDDSVDPTAVDGLDVTGAAQPQNSNPDVATAQVNNAPDAFAPIPNYQPQDTSQSPAPASPQDASPQTPQTAAPPGLNYNNSTQANALNTAMSDPSLPALRGGSANPGIYGLLPQSMQHGTLRNVLGALGDAFLVQSGHDPIYRPRMEQQAIGQAMAGFDINDPDKANAAIQRVAATGAPGAQQMVEKMQAAQAQAAYRKSQMELHQDQLAQTGEYHYANQLNHEESQLARRIPIAGQMANNATTLEQYQLAHDRAEALAQKIGSDYHASDLGLVDPEDWKPGMRFGLTANQELVSSDKGAARQQSDINSVRHTNAMLGANSANNQTRLQTARMNPNNNARAQELGGKIKDGTATPQEQQEFDHLTAVPKSARRAPPTVAQSHPTAGNLGMHQGYPIMTPAQATAAARLPGNKGKKFYIQGSSELQSYH